MTTKNIPIFPLNTVIFPGGPLPLRIFEPRYTDMVSECMRENKGFGVSLITAGNETGKAAQVERVGTYVKIIDWGESSDGLLTITALGKQRFHTLNHKIDDDQLVRAEIEFINEPETVKLSKEYASVAELLKILIKKVGKPYTERPPVYHDTGWVAGRLLELLPFKNADKQKCLEMDDVKQRLDQAIRLMAMHSII